MLAGALTNPVDLIKVTHPVFKMGGKKGVQVRVQTSSSGAVECFKTVVRLCNLVHPTWQTYTRRQIHQSWRRGMDVFTFSLFETWNSTGKVAFSGCFVGLVPECCGSDQIWCWPYLFMTCSTNCELSLWLVASETLNQRRNEMKQQNNFLSRMRGESRHKQNRGTLPQKLKKAYTSHTAYQKKQQKTKKQKDNRDEMGDGMRFFGC